MGICECVCVNVCVGGCEREKGSLLEGIRGGVCECMCVSVCVQTCECEVWALHS